MYLDTSLDDVLWVYFHLDHPSVQRSDAPTPAAWNMLTWSREARTRFYTTTFARAVAASAEQEVAEWQAFHEEMGPEWMVEHGLHRMRLRDLEAVVDAPAGLVKDVRAMVAEWGKAPDDEFSEALVLRLTGVVAEALEATANNPQGITSPSDN